MYEEHWSNSFCGPPDTFPVMLVAGARQVGKTTFLRELGKKGRAYANLDDPGWMLDELGLEELK